MDYNPNKHTGSNKPFAVTGKPDGARTYYYDDGVTFSYRVYLSKKEVLDYLPTQDDREGHTLFVINSGGTIDVPTASVSGGTNSFWYFKDGYADSNLVLLIDVVDDTLLSLVKTYSSKKISDLVATLALKATKINGFSLTTDINLSKGDIGLPLSDNTSDLQKPVSVLQKAAIDAIAGGSIGVNPTDPAIANINIYKALAAATYPNQGNIVVSSSDLLAGDVQLIRSVPGTWTKKIVPNDLSAYVQKANYNYGGAFATFALANAAIPNSINPANNKNYRDGTRVDIGTVGAYTSSWWRGGTGDPNLIKAVPDLNLSNLTTSDDIKGTLTASRYYNVDGTIGTNFSGSSITGKIPISPGDVIGIQTDLTGAPIARHVIFAANGTTVIHAFTTPNNVLTKKTAPVGSAFIGITGLTASGITVTKTYPTLSELQGTVSTAVSLSTQGLVSVDKSPTIMPDYYYDGTTGVLTSYATLGQLQSFGLTPILDTDIIYVTAVKLTGAYATVVITDSAGVVLKKYTTSFSNQKVDLPTGSAFIGTTQAVNSGSVMAIISFGKRLYQTDQAFTQVTALQSDYGLKDVSGALITDYYYSATNGVLTSFGGTLSMELVQIPAGSILSITARKVTSAVFATAAFFDVNKAFISAITSDLLNARVTPPTGTIWVGIGQRPDDSATPLSLKIYGKYRATLDTFDAAVTELKTEPNAKANKYFTLGLKFKDRKLTTAANNYGIVFLGQSNMTNQIPYSQLTALSLPTSLVRTSNADSGSLVPYAIANSSNWGVDWSISYRLDAYLNKPIIRLNKAVAGTNLYSQWNPSTNIMTALPNVWATAMVNLMASMTLNSKCIVWIQGESDNVEPYNGQYYNNLKNIIQFFRGVIGDPILPTIVVGVHTSSRNYDQKVRDGQLRVVAEDPYCIFVNPNAIPWTVVADGQNLHYDGAYAETLAAMIFNVIKDY